MICGFEFDIDTAVMDCQKWLSSDSGVQIEHIETQRASLENILRLDTTLTADQQGTIKKVEKILYEYLVANGGISAPVLRDEAQGGDLLYIPFDK